MSGWCMQTRQEVRVARRPKHRRQLDSRARSRCRVKRAWPTVRGNSNTQSQSCELYGGTTEQRDPETRGTWYATSSTFRPDITVLLLQHGILPDVAPRIPNHLCTEGARLVEVHIVLASTCFGATMARQSLILLSSRTRTRLGLDVTTPKPRRPTAAQCARQPWCSTPTDSQFLGRLLWQLRVGLSSAGNWAVGELPTRHPAANHRNHSPPTTNWLKEDSIRTA